MRTTKIKLKQSMQGILKLMKRVKGDVKAQITTQTFFGT